jgi:hypothetical protein
VHRKLEDHVKVQGDRSHLRAKENLRSTSVTDTLIWDFQKTNFC